MTVKPLILATWIFAIGSFFVATGSPAAGVGRTIFWFLVVAHAVECGIFFPKLRRAPGSLGAHLWQTFVYGVFHVRGIPRTGQ